MSEELSKAQEPKEARRLTGQVHSDKMEKTITVQVTRPVKHPLYGKYINRQTRYYAHDEEGLAREGDLVVIQQTRPLSKKKRWRLVEVLRRAGGES
jgi:small subunit ribosomal protein S17